jgi:hypothetical protein
MFKYAPDFLIYLMDDPVRYTEDGRKMEIIKMATYTINLPDLHKITVFTDQ